MDFVSQVRHAFLTEVRKFKWLDTFPETLPGMDVRRCRRVSRSYDVDAKQLKALRIFAKAFPEDVKPSEEFLLEYVDYLKGKRKEITK